ncbi:hypothetical protein GCM10010297_19880 [Streptomyces malachitofuscus]|nr:hypothetical protein GCM10010297_19880 [Streptomyces malachitofuscus]
MGRRTARAVPGGPPARPAAARPRGQGAFHRRGGTQVRDAHRRAVPAGATRYGDRHGLHKGVTWASLAEPGYGRTPAAKLALFALVMALAVVSLAGSLGVVLLATALPAT